MAEIMERPFSAANALDELSHYFREMANLKRRQMDTCSSHPGEANTLDGEREAYEHAQEMVASYITRLDLIARSLAH